MNHRIKAVFAALLALSALLFTVSCGGKDEKLPAVVTQGLPTGNSSGTGTEMDYTYDIYSSYAAITAYDGKESELAIPQTLGGKSVLLIASSAFAGNKTLEKVILPEGLRILGQSAFDKCEKLREVVFPQSLERIGDYSFRETALTAIDLKDMVCYIGKYAFMSTSLSSVTLPDSVSELGKYAFSNCDSLTSVTLSKRLTSLPNRCFSSCGALTEFIVPTQITKIEEYCFSACDSLSKLVIPKTVTDIGEGLISSSQNAVIHTVSGATAEACAKRNGYSLNILSETDMAAYYPAS